MIKTIYPAELFKLIDKVSDQNEDATLEDWWQAGRDAVNSYNSTQNATYNADSVLCAWGDYFEYEKEQIQ